MTQPPDDLLAFARTIREQFGDGVKLKFAADERTGQNWGNASHDLAPDVPSQRGGV